MMRVSCQLPRALGLLVSLWFFAPVARAAEPDAAPRISYYQHIRPIFQAHCQGCHQPAKARGDYIMTDFAKLLAGGASGDKAVIAKNPAKSALVTLITPVNGEAQMPEGKKPLAETEIDLIKKWIAEGAVDDTPANARQRFDPDHPPLYTRPPVITALDFSPDGKTLAVAGFHEVLLVDNETGALAGRLIGLAERIESVRFSPDGKRLAVSGGLPGRMGEIQVWDVERRRLLLSAPLTFDTVYGASWSPDGTQIAVGCGDNTVRAIDAKTGEQILYQGAHSDWALNTVFSKDGANIVSVSRDMTVKLTEVATQRFVDNVTSITPGALKGGIMAIARHPERDEIVLGGSDGVVKVYRIFRLTNRVIGDDANLIRRMPAMRGRTWSVAVSADGKRIAAGSSLDGAGQVHIYGYEFDTGLPANIRAISSKTVQSRTPAEKETLEKHHSEGTKRIAQAELKTGIYAVAFHPDNKVVAAAGSDGIVRYVDAESGAIVKEIAPAPITQATKPGEGRTAMTVPAASVEVETPPPASQIQAIDVEPKTIQLDGKFAYAQLVVTARLANGDLIDVTRMVEYAQPEGVANVSRTGLAWAKLDGKGALSIKLGNLSARVPVEVSGLRADQHIDFIRDVNPVLTRLGCNAGTCHGAAAGKNGFKLSLRGYDPLADVRALTDDQASRRVNIASPDDSLMLLKSTSAVAHVGGQVTRPGEPYYEIIRAWIADGAKLERATPKVAKIEVQPHNPVVQKLGGKQQLRVVATYADGTVRDVSREAFIDSGNTEVATAAQTGGLMTAIRRGESAMLVRFEGAYTATTLTVMGDRDGFAWQAPPAFNKIDEFTAAKWQRMKIQPSELCDDPSFLRRAYIDLVGLPPTADDVRAFLADTRDTKIKRDELIDKLIGSEAYVEYWTNRWADLLLVNRKFLGPQGAAAFRKWIRDEVAKNTPYDEFARKVLTASGSNRDNPPASYFKVLRDPDLIMENTTHLFMAVRFNCNKCHDHPFERWTQDNYYETAAYFARVGLKADPKAGGTIGGTAVEKGKPLYEIIEDRKDGDVTHLRTSSVAEPKFPFPATFTAAADDTRRELLADWITAADNRYFARSYVNRLWGYLFGVGIIDPIDDIRAGNPPTNPELLDYLTKEFIDSGFNVQHVLKLIAKSRTYQLSVATNKWNEDDKINYSHANARRLPAEVLLDSLYRVTGSQSKLPGVPPNTRAAALPDSGVDLPSGFLGTFGRPVRETSCECERTGNLQLGPVMALVNGQTLADAIGDPGNDIAKLVAAEKDDAKLVNELFLRILNRAATDKEIQTGIDTMRAIGQDHAKLAAALKQREQQVNALKPKLEADRQAAIAKAKQELETYRQATAAQVAEAVKQRADRIQKAEAAVKDQEEKLAPKQAEWEKAQADTSAWIALKPKEAKASVPAIKLAVQPDLSVLASGPGNRVSYTVTAETDLKGITGIRLEMLADDRLPGKGPGRSPNGNFVLSEFEVAAAPKGKGAAKKLVLQKPQASFNQEQYNVKTAIDGKAPTERNGWGVNPRTGIDHWAIFETKDDVGHEGGTVLTFTLDQQYIDRMHSIGKFRILVTTAPRPIKPGLPADVLAILKVEPEQRTPDQQAKVRQQYLRQDGEYVKRLQALDEAKRPLPIDPRLKALEEDLAFASKPLPEDPLLTQLRIDVDISAKQLANPRLTGAQDIAWALINSPSFLFNR